MMKIQWTIFFWFLKAVTAQNSNCDFYQAVDSTNTYYIYSPQYPGNYTGRLECRWIADCPVGYNCRLQCPDILIPQSTSCMLDRLLVSKTGDAQLSGADTYCGRGSLTAVSTGRRITVGLITSGTTRGGRFLCTLSAQLSTPSTSCSCGERKQNRIVGGEETGINEYKMMAGLVDVINSQIMCGAVIISDRHVLTAAHCVIRRDINGTAVVVGEHDVETGDSASTRAYRIANVIIHPSFSETTYDNDIAIVTVVGSIQFNNDVGPVCLPFKFQSDTFAGDLVTILGWGTTSFGGPVSNVLLKADVDVISQAQCRQQEPTVTPRQMCTFTPGKDACQFDSGGPLLYTDPDTGLLFTVGIISTGRSCASSSPAINTRVTAFLDWIMTNTRINYCIK